MFLVRFSFFLKLQLNVQFLVIAVSTISYFNVYLDYEKSNSWFAWT